MAGGLTVNGTTFADLSTNQGASGEYLAWPPIGDAPSDNGPEFNQIAIPYAGSTTVYTKNVCFLGQDFTFTAVFMDSSPSAAYAAKKDFIDSLVSPNGTFSMTWVDGSSYDNCILKQGGAQDLKLIALNTKSALFCKISIRSLSQ